MKMACNKNNELSLSCSQYIDSHDVEAIIMTHDVEFPRRRFPSRRLRMSSIKRVQSQLEVNNIFSKIKKLFAR